MRPLILLALLAGYATGALAAPQEVDTGALTYVAALLGDASIALQCKIRSPDWAANATSEITLRLDGQVFPLVTQDPSGLSFISAHGMINEAVLLAMMSGQSQWRRYGQAACKAIIDDGSLKRLDDIVAFFRARPKQ